MAAMAPARPPPMTRLSTLGLGFGFGFGMGIDLGAVIAVFSG
jgi:hypothetical protein